MGQEKKMSQPSSFRLRSSSLNSLRLRKIFDMFDKNGDDIITVKEISQAMSLLGLEAEMAELESLTKSYIRPGNEGLAFEDFLKLHESLGEEYFGFMDSGGDEEKEEEKKEQEESDLWEAFKVFDENGDGYISARELQVVLGKLGLSEGDEIESVQKMIVSVDVNRDGRVDFSEFKNMMRSTIVKN
ncbi:Calcium-binding protein cml42 [Stylosanthes scabra]|uniref:Calcium-binding protein cml42 n=1 Tax=Stylosanthes scabra TaxID=79078 RepID=A0ABU6VAY8_9FABA|nr:Calcium-binding protein cml42 [Stylosanthes scabra]